MPGAPKFRRRKADRPAEIVAAALTVFAHKGFAAAKLDEIAALAGVSKGALYLYFPTKEDLFRAVVEQALLPNVQIARDRIAAYPGPFTELLQILPDLVADLMDRLPLGGVVKMVIGEARNFPELARVWHDALVADVLGAITEVIAAAQARGEVRGGDPRAYALQLIAPLLASVIWNETFAPVGAAPVDLRAVARQHVATLRYGLFTEREPA